MVKKKIVVIGGGSGNFMVLSGLKKYPVELTAVVCMSDDGGSTGILRDEMGVLPPGDVRQCLVALSHSSQTLRDLFNYRYSEPGLSGHSFGNLFLSTLEKITGSFESAVTEASRILRIKGWVFPVTLENTRLVAVFKDGTKIVGQKNISYCDHDFSDLKELSLEPKAKLNPKILKTLKSLKKTDKIVISPGNFHSTLIPNFLVDGLAKAIKGSKAKVICVVNLMARVKQTDKFTLNDYILNLEKYIGKNTIKHAIYNTETPSKELLEKYAQGGEKIMPTENFDKIKSVKFLGHKLLGKKVQVINKNDALASRRSLIRHDPDKLAKIIYNL